MVTAGALSRNEDLDVPDSNDFHDTRVGDYDGVDSSGARRNAGGSDGESDAGACSSGYTTRFESEFAIVDPVVTFRLNGYVAVRTGAVQRLQPILLVAMNDSDTCSEDRAPTHPCSGVTIEELAILLTELQARHKLTAKCIGDVSSLLKQCFPNIVLPRTRSGAFPFRASTRLSEIHCCPNGCTAYLGEHVNR